MVVVGFKQEYFQNRTVKDHENSSDFGLYVYLTSYGNRELETLRLECIRF